MSISNMLTSTFHSNGNITNLQDVLRKPIGRNDQSTGLEGHHSDLAKSWFYNGMKQRSLHIVGFGEGWESLSIQNR